MKNGVLGEDGQVWCPTYGSVSFRLKRSFKAKAGIGIAGVATLGVGAAAGALAAPKRIKCLACGELFKARADPGPAPAPRPTSPLAIPIGVGNRGLCTLVVRGGLVNGQAIDAAHGLRRDLTSIQVEALLRAAKDEPQALLGDRPNDEIEIAVVVLGRTTLRYEVVDHPPAVTPPPLATMIVKRAMAFGPTLDVICEIRPDLTRDQAKVFCAATKQAPQPLLVARPLLEVEVGAKRLRRTGPSVDVVLSGPPALPGVVAE